MARDSGPAPFIFGLPRNTVDEDSFRGIVPCMTSPLSITKIELHLEHGPYAWPGGYPMYFIASDGEALSFDAVQENIVEVREAHETNDRSGGWLIVGVDTNWEDEDLVCSHTGKTIECAYPSDKAAA